MSPRLPCAMLAGAMLSFAAHAQTPAAAPAAPAPSSPQRPPAIPDAAAGVEQVAADQVVALLGIAVLGPGKAALGRIVDVLVDAAGQPRAAVVDVGGFLGMGSRKVALDWRLLHFSLGKTPAASLGLPADRIKSAPVYDPDKPVEIVEAPPPDTKPPETKPPETKPPPATGPAPP